MDDVILISGKGYPDIATSELVKCLVDTHGDSLICAALVDGDPHGLDILSVYRHGSSNRAFDRARLAAPNLGWLGVRSEDLREYLIRLECSLRMLSAHSCDVQDSALLPLTSRDRKKALSMLARRPPLPDDVRCARVCYLCGALDFKLNGAEPSSCTCFIARAKLKLKRCQMSFNTSAIESSRCSKTPTPSLMTFFSKI